MATELELVLLAEKWRGHTELLKRLGHLPPQAPRPLKDEDAPLSSYDREAIRSVRCEQCCKVLPYGTRALKQIDDPEAPPVYLCKRCKSDHEHRYVKEENGNGTGWGEAKPAKRTCRNLVLSDDRGRVKDVLLGCGATTEEWSEEGSRWMVHKPGCQRYQHDLKTLRTSTS